MRGYLNDQAPVQTKASNIAERVRNVTHVNTTELELPDDISIVARDRFPHRCPTFATTEGSVSNLPFLPSGNADGVTYFR